MKKKIKRLAKEERNSYNFHKKIVYSTAVFAEKGGYT